VIDVAYGLYFVYCDGCGRDIDGTYSDFEDALDGMKAQDWKSVKEAPDIWMNYCPKCAAKYGRPGPSEFAGIH